MSEGHLIAKQPKLTRVSEAVALEEQEELRREAACQKKQVNDLEATRRKNEKSFRP